MTKHDRDMHTVMWLGLLKNMHLILSLLCLQLSIHAERYYIQYLWLFMAAWWIYDSIRCELKGRKLIRKIEADND